MPPPPPPPHSSLSSSSPLLPFHTHKHFDLKAFSLDVWERCIFWLCIAYTVATAGTFFFGIPWLTLFYSVFSCSCFAVVFVDKLYVDPAGKCVLITGCDTGFGFNAAKKLHAMGYTVFATVISKDTEGARTLQREYNKNMFIVQMDVTSDSEVEEGLEFVKQNLPRGSKGLWAGLFNAGWSTFGEVEMVPMDVYERIMDINLFGTIRVIKAALPLIRQASGRVIMTSSMMGRFGAPSRSPYCCTKWAIEGLAECLRAEMIRWNVKVSVVEPGNFIAGTALYAGDAIAKQADHIWGNLSESVKRDYGKGDFDRLVQKMRSYTSGGVCDIEPVLKAYCDAVSHSFPQTRYQVMTLQEKIKCFLSTHVPSVLYDKIYN